MTPPIVVPTKPPELWKAGGLADWQLEQMGSGRLDMGEAAFGQNTSVVNYASAPRGAMKYMANTVASGRAIPLP